LYTNKSILIFILVIILLSSRNLISQEINNAVGVNVFNSFSFWGNQYPEDSFENLGIGTFISPTYKMNLNNFHFQFSVMLSYFNFTGPDDLTRTGPDDDIDGGFDSYMNRNDIGFQIGYKLSDYINLALESKYIYLNIKGDSDYKFTYQSPFSYNEKGFLFGPGINLNYPENNSNSFFTLSTFYLIGELNYTYKSHRSEIIEPYKNSIDSQLLSANIGYSFHINSNWLLGISLESDYFFKRKQAYDYKYSSNLWFVGINTNIFYQL